LSPLPVAIGLLYFDNAASCCSCVAAAELVAAGLAIRSLASMFGTMSYQRSGLGTAIRGYALQIVIVAVLVDEVEDSDEVVTAGVVDVVDKRLVVVWLFRCVVVECEVELA
jgi:hypothetical protein